MKLKSLLEEKLQRVRRSKSSHLNNLAGVAQYVTVEELNGLSSFYGYVGEWEREQAILEMITRLDKALTS